MSRTGILNQMRNLAPLIEQLNNIQIEIDNPISKMHNYLAKKPYNVISQIINYLTEESNIVFDGFMGSGTTGYESLKLKRKFIGVDINKISINYFYNAVSNYNIDAFDQLFNILQENIFPLVNDIYSTICPKCSSKALIEREMYDVDDSDILVLKKIKYICHTCSPGRKAGIYIDARDEDHQSLKELKPLAAKYENLFSTPLLENKHIAIQPGSCLKDYFSIRGQLAVGAFLDAVKALPDVPEKELIYFTMSASLHLFKLSDYKASSQIPYWRPKQNVVSRNPIPFFIERYELIREGVSFSKESGINHTPFDNINEIYNSRVGSYIIYDSVLSNRVREIKDESVSLIITDPPYSEQVPYLEYTAMWDILLNLDNLSKEKLDKEIVVSNSPLRKKDANTFKEELGQAICEMGRILKENHYFCIFYHDFSLDYWKQIIASANKAGLAFVTQIHVGRKQKSLKTVWDANRTLDGSALVFFVKNNDLVKQQTSQHFDLEYAEQLVKQKADEILLSKEGSATSQELYDEGVLSVVIENNCISTLSSKYKTFIQMFRKWYTFDGGKWYISS